MGLATSFVLISSATILSILKRFIPKEVRIASYIVIIATFVTMADMVLAALFPEISAELGPYVPLIIVNCLILGRVEAFASRNPVSRSILDALGMSLGFIGALLVLSSVREILGTGMLFGVNVTFGLIRPWLLMVLPGGAFLSLGALIGLSRMIEARRVKA